MCLLSPKNSTEIPTNDAFKITGKTFEVVKLKVSIIFWLTDFLFEKKKKLIATILREKQKTNVNHFDNDCKQYDIFKNSRPYLMASFSFTSNQNRKNQLFSITKHSYFRISQRFASRRCYSTCSLHGLQQVRQNSCEQTYI